MLLSVAACKKPAIKETGAKLKYFDLKGYFQKDSARLTHLNKPVYKTVVHNGDAESKRVYINNWGLELNLFEQSDINRPAWNDSYTIHQSGDIIIYQATTPELRTHIIMIKQVNGKVKSILIYNSTKNILYSTQEKLTYIPDSLYMIERKQSVRILGTNRYLIKGLFNQ